MLGPFIQITRCPGKKTMGPRKNWLYMLGRCAWCVGEKINFTFIRIIIDTTFSTFFFFFLLVLLASFYWLSHYYGIMNTTSLFIFNNFFFEKNLSLMPQQLGEILYIYRLLSCFQIIEYFRIIKCFLGI